MSFRRCHPWMIFKSKSSGSLSIAIAKEKYTIGSRGFSSHPSWLSTTASASQIMGSFSCLRSWSVHPVYNHIVVGNPKRSHRESLLSSPSGTIGQKANILSNKLAVLQELPCRLILNSCTGFAPHNLIEASMINPSSACVGARNQSSFFNTLDHGLYGSLVAGTVATAKEFLCLDLFGGGNDLPSQPWPHCHPYPPLHHTWRGDLWLTDPVSAVHPHPPGLPRPQLPWSCASCLQACFPALIHICLCSASCLFFVSSRCFRRGDWVFHLLPEKLPLCCVLLLLLEEPLLPYVSRFPFLFCEKMID